MVIISLIVVYLSNSAPVGYCEGKMITAHILTTKQAIAIAAAAWSGRSSRALNDAPSLWRPLKIGKPDYYLTKLLQRLLGTGYILSAIKTHRASSTIPWAS